VGCRVWGDWEWLCVWCSVSGVALILVAPQLLPAVDGWHVPVAATLKDAAARLQSTGYRVSTVLERSFSSATGT
jgi:hypothetical protein